MNVRPGLVPLLEALACGVVSVVRGAGLHPVRVHDFLPEHFFVEYALK
jgi:hypothetical protein